MSSTEYGVKLTPSLVSQYAKFLTNHGKNIRMLHFTHSDLDGIGCSVINKLASHAMNGRKSHIPTYYVAKPDTINTVVINTIDHLIRTVIAYENVNTFNILITDISMVRSSIVNDLQKRFGDTYTFHVIVVDHHQRSEEEILQCDVMNANPKFDINFYYSTAHCATYMMYEIISQLISRDSYFITRMNTILEFAELVNKYDTGKWGNWTAESIISSSKKKLAEEVRLQLIITELREWFDFVSPIKNTSAALRPIADLFVSIIHIYNKLPTKIYYTNKPNTVTNVHRPDRSGQVVGQEMLDKLHAEYDKFNSAVRPITEVSVKSSSICNPTLFMSLITALSYNGILDKVKIYQQKTRKELNFFSLISRRYFEENPGCDVLIVWNEDFHNVELRSNGTVDVSQIAKMFGGGGHICAAGFPIPKLIEEK